MKGYSRLETAQAAAERLRAQGHAVTTDMRNGWYVLHVTSEPALRCDVPQCCATGVCANPEACHVPTIRSEA